MQRIRKSGVCLFFVLCLTLAMMPYSAFAQETSAVSVPALSATRVSSHSIRLRWSPVSGADKITIYRSLRSHKKSTFKKLATLHGGASAYTDSRVSPNRYYAYTIRSGNVNSNQCRVYTSTGKSRYVNARSISIIASSSEIRAGSRLKLHARIYTGNKKKRVASRSLRWSSSDHGIAKVNDNGVVKALNAGTCTITATAHNGRKAAMTMTVTGFVPTKKVAVMTFHSIVPDSVKSSQYPTESTAASETLLRNFLQYLNDNGYRTLTTDEFYQWYTGQIELPRKSVLITFDDGLRNLYTNACPILKEYHVNATAFLITGSMPEKPAADNGFLSWSEAASIKKDYPNVDLESHTYGMHVSSQNIFSMSREQISADYKSAYETTAIHGMTFNYIAYPWGNYTPDMQAAAQENGMKLGFTYPGTTTSSARKKATRQDPVYAVNRIRASGNFSLQEMIRLL